MSVKKVPIFYFKELLMIWDSLSIVLLSASGLIQYPIYWATFCSIGYSKRRESFSHKGIDELKEQAEREERKFPTLRKKVNQWPERSLIQECWILDGRSC